MPLLGQEAVMRGSFVVDTGIPDPGIYLGWGNFLIQFGNLIVIVLMIVLSLNGTLTFTRASARAVPDVVPAPTEWLATEPRTRSWIPSRSPWGVCSRQSSTEPWWGQLGRFDGYLAVGGRGGLVFAGQERGEFADGAHQRGGEDNSGVFIDANLDQ